MGLIGDIRAVFRGSQPVLPRDDPRVQVRSPIGGVYRLTDIAAPLRALTRNSLDLMPQIAARVGSLRGRNRPTERATAALHELRQHGVVVVPGVIPTGLLARVRDDFEQMVPEIDRAGALQREKPASTGGRIAYRVHEHQADLGIHRTHDPLMFSAAFAELAFLPVVEELLLGYLGPSYNHQAWVATRTHPAAPERHGFAQWHHDARGRKLNLLFLLTDVPAEGQATVVLRGSHRLYYSFARRRRNFFTDAEVDVVRAKYGFDEFVCNGAAGSLVAFDSNGLHRGRRGPGVRDVVQLNAMSRPGHRWSHEMPRSRFDELAPSIGEQLLRRADLHLVG